MLAMAETSNMIQIRVACVMRGIRHHHFPPSQGAPLLLLKKPQNAPWTHWFENKDPKHISVPAHGSSVITCLLFSHNRIITASNDHTIHVWAPQTGELIHILQGHQGGVWSLAATKDVLVSGSTDATIRVWDLNTGKCRQVFRGHTSTVRCLIIVKPEMVHVEGLNGSKTKGKWPKRSLIVSGSRDHDMRVWTLPKLEDPEFLEPQDVNSNPYHRLLLKGHHGCVRGLPAQGRTAISGSYDTSLRVWNIIDEKCKFVLQGHTNKVYSVALDLRGQRAYSGSMDMTVKIWDISLGTCLHTLTAHTSLVGLITLSPSYLVTASADSKIIIWDPTTGKLLRALEGHKGAITAYYHDEFKVLSGGNGELKMWDVREGVLVRRLLEGSSITGVWQVTARGRWCVAVTNRSDASMLDIWDFGGEDLVEEDMDDGLEDDGDDDREANARIVQYLQTA